MGNVVMPVVRAPWLAYDRPLVIIAMYGLHGLKFCFRHYREVSGMGSSLWR